MPLKKKRGPGRPKGSKNKPKARVVKRKSRLVTKPIDEFSAQGLDVELSAEESSLANRELFREPSKTSPNWQFDGGVGGETRLLDPALGGKDALYDTNTIVKINRMEKQMYFMVSKYREMQKLMHELTSFVRRYTQVEPGARGF